MQTTTKIRLDLRLIQLGLATSRQKAKDYIESGRVKIDSVTAEKCNQRVTLDNQIQLIDPDTWVSRGSYKLLSALFCFNINLSGKICLDIGASTGGFTQVCLKAGAKKVYAVDIGTDQLHPSLKTDSRVISLEQTHIKDLTLAEKVDFVCVDVSFISARQVLPYLLSFIANKAEIVILIKPQYEVGKENLPANGIVTDENLHKDCITKIKNSLLALNLIVGDCVSSPIKGKAGNTEYLIHAIRK